MTSASAYVGTSKRAISVDPYGFLKYTYEQEHLRPTASGSPVHPRSC